MQKPSRSKKFLKLIAYDRNEPSRTWNEVCK